MQALILRDVINNKDKTKQQKTIQYIVVDPHLL